ncbi:MAG: hypothetical protein K2W86_01220 [Sphingomonas sp.]|uniref:hypothetical protein n=1 Tax=Sphingomonas sp. TaxID=28214 RepID=UPI0035A960F9|nr:hypothetical protein [Sphingomonas sp.]
MNVIRRDILPMWRQAALIALPAITFLLVAAADDKKSKSSVAIWIALAAVFIALGASMAGRLNKAPKNGKGTSDGGGDAPFIGSDAGHGKHHADAGHGGDGGDGGGDGGGGD